MEENKQKVAENATEKTIEKATEAARALEASRTADTASLLEQLDRHMKYQAAKNMLDMEKTLTKLVSDSLGSVPSRYIDASRIPLICQSIFSIEKHLEEAKAERERNMKEIQETYVNKDQFNAIKKDVDTHDDYISWGIKIVIGAVLLAGLSFIIVTNK